MVLCCGFSKARDQIFVTVDGSVTVSLVISLFYPFFIWFYLWKRAKSITIDFNVHQGSRFFWSVAIPFPWILLLGLQRLGALLFREECLGGLPRGRCTEHRIMCPISPKDVPQLRNLGIPGDLWRSRSGLWPRMAKKKQRSNKAGPPDGIPSHL